MKAQDVIWTALPNGRKDASTLKLSVYISPRLMTDQGLPAPTLSLFNDFLNWPTVPVSYKVFMGSFGPFTGTIVTSPPAANDLYTSVFKTTTYVRPHQFPTGLASAVRIRSYPVHQIRGFVKDQYTKFVAGSPTDHPPFGQLNAPDAFGGIGFVAPDQAGGGSGEQKELQLSAQLEAILQRNQWVDFTQFNPTDPNYNALAFLLAKRFHQPRSGVTQANTDPVTLTKPTLAAAGPDKAIDFHQMVTLATEHPALMRYLGFVVDLEFQPSGVPFGTTNVRVVPTWTPQLAAPATKNYSPKTRCKLSSTDFGAAPRTVSPELADGALPLEDPSRFELVEIDHDGSALKAMQFANNIQRGQLTEHQTTDTPTSYALPSLRSGGLSVARIGMAGRLLDNIKTSSNINGTFKTGVTLNAEDVVRGYAVHIWDSASGKWHSLLSRTGTYDFVDKPEAVPVSDEGAVSLGPTSDPLNPSPDLYQQETLFLWSGWSLAAQRPGNTLVTDPAHDAGGPMQRVDSTADADFRVQIRYKVQPGTLPRLRYGVNYQVRARAVDLAGNRIPFGDPTLPDAHASPMITYARFEPVDSPVVLLRKPRTPGESAEQIVIRSNYNTAATLMSQRHISPTKIAEMVAEEHGLFDTPNVIDPAAFNLIVSRDDKTYMTSPQAKIDPFEYDGVQYFDVNKLTLPFFPDPIGRGASFRDLPGLPAGSIAKMPYLPAPTTAWPAYVPFRFILEEGGGAPVRDVTNGTLTVQIPKAEVVTVRYSTYLDAPDLGLIGVWNWLPVADQTTLQPQALDGQLWAITPWRNLTLVHAVRQPLLIPQFLSMPGPFRDTIGQTIAFFPQSSMQVSRNSTGEMKVFADWTEAIDAGPASSVDPTHSKKSAVAFQVDLSDPLAGGATDTLMLQNERQEFHDTKYRKVSYRAVATSKFLEYFQQKKTVLLSGVTPVVVNTKGFVPETVKVKSVDGKTTYVPDKDFTADEATGRIQRTATSAIASGAQVMVPFVAPPVVRPGPTEAPIVTTVNNPNSARPAAPDVLYIVPTWKWASKAIAGGTKSTRTGGGLRVYMNRPWWSSGDGELLGVLLWPFVLGGPPEPPNTLKPYVSRWGIDPIHASQSTTQPPTLSQFTLRKASSATPLSLEELADQPSVLVAGHQVGFDSVRKLWYCDIAVDTGPAYFPFVRLALARYQPNSLTNAHLSRAVLADFVQTVQGRTFTVVRSGTNPLLLTVTAVGISYTATRNADQSLRTGPSTMRVQLEQRSHKLAGDFGWEAVGSPIELSPSQSGTDTTWTGRVLLPSGNWPLRLVVEEVEKLSADGTFGPTGTLERLVYTDIVPVSPDQFGVLTPTPSSVDFGPVNANQDHAVATVSVKNTGAAPLTVGAVSIIGTDAAQFSIDTDTASGAVLNPGLTASVVVRFTPTQIGTFNAQLDFPDDAIPNPLDVNLTGVGQGAVLGVQPTSLNFGNQAVGVMSPQMTLTLTNSGNANLVIGTTSIVGSSQASFQIVTDASGVTVPPGGNTNMTLTARPISGGSNAATLMIPSNAAGSPLSVGLNCVGV